MQRLFSGHPSFLEDQCLRRPSHEWIMPAVQRTHQLGTYKKLPAGKPDCLCVEVIHFDEGVERCAAAMYKGRAYVIHYEFRPHAYPDV